MQRGLTTVGVLAVAIDTSRVAALAVTVITPPGLEETLSILENKVGNQNWTSVAIKLRDPDNRR